MRRELLTFILLLFYFLIFSQDHKLVNSLKEDYYREMATRENIDPDIRIIWYDSLLNLSSKNKDEIRLEKIDLLAKSGYVKDALQLSNELLKNKDNLPLNNFLRLLYLVAGCLHAENDFTGAFTKYNEILNLPKPDSLKYWDIKSGIAMFTLYDELNDKTRANEWLKITEDKISNLPLDKSFRRDAEARIHGSKATLLISENKLDSAYNELKIAKELAEDDITRLAILLQTAQLCMEKGELSAAHQYLQEALKINVNGQQKRTAVYLEALCYLREKRYEETLETLASYPQETIKINSLGNLRAYYILKGQAYAGLGNLVLAYNSLDSALVVGDSIVSKMRLWQTLNSENYIKAQKDSELAREKEKALKGWIIGLAISSVVSTCVLIILLIGDLKLRKKIRGHRDLVIDARHKMNQKIITEAQNQENEDNLNRKQTSLLLRLAHLEAVLGSLKKKLETDNFDKSTRDSLLRQLHEINGKGKMWDLFQMQFEVTNRKFLDLLSERHPDLTKSEKRICAFMLINLSSKEIANLLDRSARTVDVTKYNLRKKMGIEIPTEEYLRQIAEEASRNNTVIRG